MTAHRSPKNRAGRDRGSITLWWVIVMAGAFMMIGLVVDGGGKLRAVENADALAAEAARAGSQAVDPTKAIPGQAIVIDPAKAVAAADDYLARAGATGTATPSADGTTLEVQVTARHKTLFLQVIGVSSLSAEGHATAELLHGVTAPEG
ncbi:Flp pilus assembly protein TadG [Kitasatospora sp. MAP12-15]|uniref:pilus assembly protein TadG-related protein n=1 Tax=unclassified Kitasatospora TaxID=2633591 RepID=UPI002474D93A|nr:pilus assembly protein TadG-related protein [Kitasatospora sp. MAP12-44]MDH6115641.1 Flp pilus assembly protein TadG [Kitasatospora sp. MAP12-44]